MQPQADPQLCSSHSPTHSFLPMLRADVDEERCLHFHIKIPPYTMGLAMTVMWHSILASKLGWMGGFVKQ